MESMPVHLRVRCLQDGIEKYRLFLGNRYEHFEPAAETESYGGDDLQVFIWTRRTYVAE